MMAVGPSEAETFRTDFLRGLARRGLRGVKLVVSEGLSAIPCMSRSVIDTLRPSPW